MRMILRQACIVVLVLLCGVANGFSAGIPAEEKRKIETLIAQVQTLKDATFIRNGSEYDAKVAARFLRGKWSSNESEIKTAQDFIAKAATSSSTSGKPYMIRFKDSREVACAEYLRGELKKLDTAKENP